MVAELSSRKANVDDVHSPQNNGKIAKDYAEEPNIENWLNALDMFCLCIFKKKYFNEINWKKEYQGYVGDIIYYYPKYFTMFSDYTNILRLHKHWNKKIIKKLQSECKSEKTNDTFEEEAVNKMLKALKKRGHEEEWLKDFFHHLLKLKDFDTGKIYG